MGHEFSQSLDNTGRLFDHFGNMNNWWKPEDEKIFNSKVANVVKQYELFASWDGIKMDASTMVGESMADISGMACCISYLNLPPYLKTCPTSSTLERLHIILQHVTHFQLRHTIYLIFWHK